MLLHTRDDRLLRSHLREHLHPPETVHLADGSTCGERAAAERLQLLVRWLDRIIVLSAKRDGRSDSLVLTESLIDLRDIALFDVGETLAINRTTEAPCSATC